MNLSGVVLEFLVIGLVAAAGLGLGLHGLDISVDPVSFDSTPAAAATGIVALLLLYSFGTAAHYLTWIWWKPWLHKRWLAAWAHGDQGELLLRGAEQRFLASPLGKSAAGYSKWSRLHQVGVVLDWCRFSVLQSGSEEIRRQYLRQFHLYRIAYGPLAIFTVGTLVYSVGIFFHAATQVELLLMVAAWAFVVGTSRAAKHRVTRMWKYLGYSVGVLW